MIKYIFSLCLFFIKSHKGKNELKLCIQQEGKFRVGQRFRKLGSSCKICECTESLEVFCKIKKSCEELNCDKKYLYESLCCEMLYCPRIRILIRIVR